MATGDRRARFPPSMGDWHPLSSGRTRGKAGTSEMTETGLQKLAFVLLLALILYVSVAGGA